MTTTPKAPEFSEDSRRAYVPAPHHDTQPGVPPQGGLDDTFAVATEDVDADDTTTPAATNGVPARDDSRVASPDDEPAEADDEDDEDDEDEDEDDVDDDEDDEEEDDEEDDEVVKDGE